MRQAWMIVAAVGMTYAAGASAQQAVSSPVGVIPGAVVPGAPASVAEVLGVAPAIEQLKALQQRGEGSTTAALLLREQVLERVLVASFDVDAVLGRIDTEASYASEDRYVLDNRKQKQNNMLNLATFAVSGALSTASSGMQLTSGLNHAGQAVGVASGATAIILSAVQLKGASGGKQPLRSPYNMLAEILGQSPNAESHYPPLIEAYLQAPSAKDGRPLTESLPAAWRRLHRLQDGPKSQGASLEGATTDASQGAKLGDDDLADREAMLHDLHATIILLRTELRGVLLEMETPVIAAGH